MQPAPTPSRAERRQQQRHELQQRIAAWVDVPLTALAFVMLALFVVDLTLPLDPRWAGRLAQAQTAIWMVFIADFALEFALAPSKSRYLQENWITVIAVLLPAVRSFRVLRATRLVRGYTVVRTATILNRGIAAIGEVFERGAFGYVLVLAVAVTVTAAAGVFFLEHDQPDAVISTPWDALWWATTLMTTINSPLEAVTLEGRIIGLVLRLVALGLSGYVTAAIAVYLLGVEPAGRRSSGAELEELQTLRREVRQLAARLPADGSYGEPGRGQEDAA